MATTIERTFTTSRMLTDPSGKRYALQKNRLGRTRDLRGTFGDELSVEIKMSSLSAIAATGIWKLKIVDSVAQDIGPLNKWKLIFKR